MDCREEVAILERRLKHLPGLEDFVPDLVGQRLRVRYDAAKLSTSIDRRSCGADGHARVARARAARRSHGRGHRTPGAGHRIWRRAGGRLAAAGCSARPNFAVRARLASSRF